MNMWIVLLVMIPVILLMFFGKNPIREFQNEQKVLVEKYGNDELTYAVSRSLEEQGAIGIDGKSVLEAPSSNEMISSIKSTSKPVSTGEDLTIKKKSEGGNRLGGNVGAGQPRFALPSVTDTKTVAKPDDFVFQPQEANGGGVNAYPPQTQSQDRDYYPNVITRDSSGSVISQAGSGTKAQIGGREARLRSGQPVIFDGASVYTVNAAGERVPMPDGDYILQDGGALKVSGGRSMLQ